MRNWNKGCTSLIILLLITFLNLGFLSGSVLSQELSAKYSKVRVYATGNEDILSMNKAGLAIDHIISGTNYFDVVFNDLEMDLLKKTGVSFEVLVNDLEAEYQSRPKLSRADLGALEAQMKKKYGLQGFGFGSMGGYYTFNEIVAELDEMVALFPNLITVKQSIGTTIEGRDIWMVKISDNPNVNESEEEVLYTALMHAREPQGMACVMYYMWYLLENYGSDSVVDFLVDNREMYFIPCINPDGYTYNESTNPNGGGNWRKNRRNNGGGIFGVDINRNFEYQWGFNNVGSSPTPSSSTYRGTAPASESETQAVENFAINHDLTMTFNFHAVAGTFNFPWGYLSNNSSTPDHDQFVAFSRNMRVFNGYPFGTPFQNLGYTTNGYSNDWFYGEQTLKNKTFSWTVEANGSGFWPSQSEIVPLAIETLHSNFVLANGVSGGMPPVVDITVTPQSPTIIPSGGAFLVFDLDLQNNTNTEWIVNYWNKILTPLGEEVGPVGGFPIPTIPLAAGGSFSTTLTLEIPGGVPPATYGFNWKVGIFANGSVDVDGFNFTKNAGPVSVARTASFNTEGWESILGTQNLVPEKFVLEQNYPNPFNPATTISYRLPIAENVSLMIYDLAGRQVRELVNENKEAGSYTVQWDGRNQTGQTVATGLYIYQIRAGQFNQNRKMLFMK
ncbi:T9SS type A sorting domain-containing protein [candidate division KSB1 bacterium]|nr:T9SS type A sorting domain-containing protein [candidate division KSB1 bacterium]